MPAASPTPTEEADATWFVPESRYGLDCATIADDALITAAVPSGSSADPLVTASGVGIAIPRVTSIISVGGNVCEWSNGCPPERPVRDQPGVFRNRRRSPIASRCGVVRDGRILRNAVRHAGMQPLRVLDERGRRRRVGDPLRRRGL